MKRIFNYICLALVLVAMTGCDKDDYLCYDTADASVRFTYEAAGLDSVTYSFRLHPGATDGVVELPVQLVGLSADHSRAIPVTVVADKTTAVEGRDYVIENSEIPAGAFQGSIRVKVLKSAEVVAGNKRLSLSLGSNDVFGPAPVNACRFSVIISNELSKANGWIFGTYSVVKHEFVIEHTGVADNYNSLPADEKLRLKNTLIKALYEYNKAHPDSPLTDEDGILITF